MLATASADGTAKLRDVASHRVLATLTGHNGTDVLYGVAFSPDAQMLAPPALITPRACGTWPPTNSSPP
jgi:WD40 repeat protein